MAPIRGDRSFGPDNPVQIRQVQVTTTVTPILTGGGAVPARITPTRTAAATLTAAATPATPPAVTTLTPGATRLTNTPEQVPASSSPAIAAGTTSSLAQRPSTSSESGEKDSGDSIFPTNLSWWQILGIAGACMAVVLLLVFIIVKRNKRNRNAKKKEKEAKAEERRIAQEEAARMREETMPHRLMGIGMGMGGMGGVPMAWGGAQGEQDHGRRRGRDRRRRDSYSDDSWDSSGSESYDDMSDGGTIRKRRRRRPRRRKERSKGRKGRRKHRERDRYSDEDEEGSPLSAASSFYARPSKSRHPERERGRDEDYRPPKSSGRDRSIKSPRRKNDLPMGLGPPSGSARTPHAGGQGSLDRKPSKRKTFRDSVFSTYDSMKRAAVRHKYMDGKVRMQKQLEQEEAIEKARQAKVREANAQLQREKDKEQRSVQQIAQWFAPAKLQQTVPLAMPVPAPAQPPATVPRSQPLVKTNSRQDTAQRSQPSRHVSAEEELEIPPPPQPRRQLSSPANAYESALPRKAVRQPTKSELPYAYDGVSSVVSSAAVGDRPAKPKPKSKMSRQDSDPPLKSAMRTPGVRKPERKLTINDKTSTIRPRARARTAETPKATAATSDFLSEWLSKPPARATTAETPARVLTSSPQSTTGSVELAIPHPKDRPVIKQGGLAPAPPPRARTKSASSRSTLSESTRSDHSSQNLLASRGPTAQPGMNGPSGFSGPGNKWTNRLRDRR